MWGPFGVTLCLRPALILLAYRLFITWLRRILRKNSFRFSWGFHKVFAAFIREGQPYGFSSGSVWFLLLLLLLLLPYKTREGHLMFVFTACVYNGLPYVRP